MGCGGCFCCGLWAAAVGCDNCYVCGLWLWAVSVSFGLFALACGWDPCFDYVCGLWLWIAAQAPPNRSQAASLKCFPTHAQMIFDAFSGNPNHFCEKSKNILQEIKNTICFQEIQNNFAASPKNVIKCFPSKSNINLFEEFNGFPASSKKFFNLCAQEIKQMSRN